jgi:hypothetical protein
MLSLRPRATLGLAGLGGVEGRLAENGAVGRTRGGGRRRLKPASEVSGRGAFSGG